jgi:hypothetical protein
MVHFEQLEVGHQIGTPPGEGIEARSEDDVLVDPTAYGLIDFPVHKTGSLIGKNSSNPSTFRRDEIEQSSDLFLRCVGQHHGVGILEDGVAVENSVGGANLSGKYGRLAYSIHNTSLPSPPTPEAGTGSGSW